MSSPPWLSLRSQPRLYGWQSGKSLALAGVLAIASGGPAFLSLRSQEGYVLLFGTALAVASLTAKAMCPARDARRALVVLPMLVRMPLRQPAGYRLSPCSSFPVDSPESAARYNLPAYWRDLLVISPNFAAGALATYGWWLALALDACAFSELVRGDGETKYFRCQMGSPVVLSH